MFISEIQLKRVCDEIDVLRNTKIKRNFDKEVNKIILLLLILFIRKHLLKI